MRFYKSIIASVIVASVPLMAQAQVTLTNPLGANMTDPRLIAARIIQGLLSIVGTLALVMFIYGGLLWLTSMGKPDKIKQGKDILIWTVIGIALIAGAYVAVDAVFRALLTGTVGTTT
ncbi:MAG: hypothetical protein WCT24_00140 [Patescibacteria group bacterium]|jgi:hypothetical protein